MTQSRLALLISETQKVLEREHIDADASLLDLGVDSMNIVELIMVCEQVYDGDIDPDALELDEYTTLRELDERLSALSCA